MVRCGSQECWITLCQFHCQFHSRWHSLRITLKSTTLVCMRRVTCEPRNRDNGAGDVWALTAYKKAVHFIWYSPVDYWHLFISEVYWHLYASAISKQPVVKECYFQEVTRCHHCHAPHVSRQGCKKNIPTSILTRGLKKVIPQVLHTCIQLYKCWTHSGYYQNSINLRLLQLYICIARLGNDCIHSFRTSSQ